MSAARQFEKAAPDSTPAALALRARWLHAAVLLALAIAWLGPTQATPITWGDKITVPLRFPKNATLNVFVATDPKGLGRDALVKEGVERWKQTLADRMITLNVSIGDPPAGTANPVRYTWEADGYSEGGQELGPGKNDGIAGPDNVAEGDTELTAGAARLRNALPAGTDAEKNYLKNLAEHELTHVLGLADDDKGAVTKHEQPTGARALNDQDKKEINALYGTAATSGGAGARGEATNTGGGSALAFFTYHFDFVAANAIPDANDPEHVSLIAFVIDPRLVIGLALSPGWIGLIPGTNVPIDHPFFAEGYMVDVISSLPPWSPTDPMSFIALRTSVQEAANDGLPPDFDPALTLANPGIDVTIFTRPGVREGPVQIYAGGALQTVIGPAQLSGPPTLPLLGMALFWLLGRRTINRALGRSVWRRVLRPAKTG